MAQIRLSEELQKQLKDGSVSDETKRLFQNFGKHQEKKLNSTKKKKSKKITPHNYVSENWAKYSEKILKIALESAKKAYEYTVSLRSQKLIGRFEILDGLNSDIKTKRIFVPTNTMQLRERIEDEHRVMLNKIYENSYTATDNIAKLLRTGQIGQFIAENEVDTAIVDFITLSLVKLDAKNIDTLFSDILAYKVRTLEECKKIANKIEKYRETAIERLCARNNYSVAKELASLSHKSNLISLDKDSEKLDEVIKTEEDYLERERIRLAEEEKRKQEAAERAAREAKERRIREEAERRRIAEERIRQEKIRLEAERKAKEEKRRSESRKRDSYRRIISERNIKELIHFTRIDNIPTILEYGILPRDQLDIYAPEAIINDVSRYDGHTDASCLSVSFPNYKMFYHYSNNNQSQWAVLSLDPQLLYDLDIDEFYFYPENAAKSETNRCSFAEMFGKSNNNLPEDPQAEILAFGVINPKYISRIYVVNDEAKNRLSQTIGNHTNIVINREYFKYRKGDYL